VFQAKASDDGAALSGDVPHAYWFTDKKIGRGDFVVLYSKKGVRKEKKNADGTTSHFFYWGLSNPLWVSGYVLTLVDTPSWTNLRLTRPSDKTSSA
jgi:hypothetical protein